MSGERHIDLEEALSSTSCDAWLVAKASFGLFNVATKHKYPHSSSLLLYRPHAAVLNCDFSASLWVKRARFPGYTAWTTVEQRGPVGL